MASILDMVQKKVGCRVTGVPENPSAVKEESIVDRLYRQAKELPEDEPLAITDNEIYEFANKIVFVTRFPNGIPTNREEAEARIIRDALAGGVKFLGHPLVVLK
jgi:hypothetical protein